MTFFASHICLDALDKRVVSLVTSHSFSPHRMQENASKIAGRDSHITCLNSQKVELKASLHRVNRFVVVFEVYNPYSILQVSEVLSEFKIVINDRVVYMGRAVVSGLVNTGLMVVCEATLDDSWQDVGVVEVYNSPEKLTAEFDAFLAEYRKLCDVDPKFKVIVTDIETLLSEFRRWLEQVELSLRAAPDRGRAETKVLDTLSEPFAGPVSEVFQRFEQIAALVGTQSEMVHGMHIKRRLHPLVLCSPFIYRTFRKPLGYAGDYEMVNMITKNSNEGATLFAKALNSWILSQAPAVGHRNRISILTERIVAETTRAVGSGAPKVRVFNLGCGPAWELQRFLADHDICERCELNLLDFNDETLAYVSTVLNGIRTSRQRRTPIRYVQRSVHQVLRKGMGGEAGSNEETYDIVYCAGLFDYLSDRICKRLVSIFYDALAPGGLLIVTNVDSSNPIRNIMEFLLEWHLVYRDQAQLRELAPDSAAEDDIKIYADKSGANIFLEVRKPQA
ncbi:MAG: extracellular factor (EF) 3-hydroxypalmitic acid methyl ester biosynthesis protein [Verrucomicrobiales bacterium]